MEHKTDTDSERAAFEAWASSNRLGAPTEQMGFRFHDAGNMHPAWQAWQARASLAASAGSEPVAWMDAERGEVVSAKWLASDEATSDYRAVYTTPLYTHPSPPEGMVGGWQDIATALEGQLVVVGWLDPEDTEHPERHDFDYMEDGCWQKWHEHAEHVEVIGGHGVSYTPPYTCWMPLPPIAAGGGKEADHGM